MAAATRRERALRVRVGDRAVRRLVGDDGQRPLRHPRGDLERDDAAEADADEDGGSTPLGVEDGRDSPPTWTSTSSGDGSASRLPPLPRRSRARTVNSPGRREQRGRGPGSWPAVESVPWSRTRATGPVAEAAVGEARAVRAVDVAHAR